MADAFVQVAESALSADIARGVPAERVQVVVHVPAESFADQKSKAGQGTTGQGATANHGCVDNGSYEQGLGAVMEPGHCGLAEDTARRLCCDASVVQLKSDSAGDESQAATRKKRLPNLALRRVLAARDRVCVMPGCGHDKHLQAHHIKHWIDGGETSADNVALLCSSCHRRVHEGGFQLKHGDDSSLRFFTPDGRELSKSPPPLQSKDGKAALYQQSAESGLALGPHTMPLWQGESMDLNWAWTLCGS